MKIILIIEMQELILIILIAAVFARPRASIKYYNPSCIVYSSDDSSSWETSAENFPPSEVFVDGSKYFSSEEFSVADSSSVIDSLSKEASAEDHFSSEGFFIDDSSSSEETSVIDSLPKVASEEEDQKDDSSSKENSKDDSSKEDSKSDSSSAEC